MSFLEVSNISRYYGDRTALREVSFNLELGQVLQIRGNNGAGKSTLLKVLSGLERPDLGEVKIEGLSLSDSTSYQKIKSKYGIGYYNSYSQFYSHLTLNENLKLSARLNEVDFSEVLSLCRRFSIDTFLNYLPAECSSGTLKKAAILRATLYHPKLLLLDEPFVHLDQVSIKLLRAYLLELIASGVSLILVSHQEVTFNSTSLVLERGAISGV